MTKRIRVTKRDRSILIVRRRNARTFEPLYREYQPIIRDAAASRKGYVPGLTREDVRAHMGVCLWFAFLKYRESDGEFHTFWWSIWLNQRAQLIRASNAVKRPFETATDYDELIRQSPIAFPYYFFDVSSPPMIVPTEDQLSVGYVETMQPVVPDEKQRVAWSLLALGYREVEVRRYLKMNNHDWYAMLELWRCPAVEWMLKEGDDD